MKAVTVSLIIAAHCVNELIRAAELMFRAAIRAFAWIPREPVRPARGRAVRELTHT
jgi:hypothetical protein